MTPTSFFSILRRWIVPGVWLALFTLAIVVFVLGMAAWFPRLAQVCPDSPLRCQQQGRLTAPEAQELQTLGYSLTFYAWFNLALRLLTKAMGVVLGALIFWRRPASVLSIVASLFLVISLETSVAEVLATVHPAWWLPTRVLGYAGGITFMLFFYIFPTGHFVPWWTKWMALVWALSYFFPSFLPSSKLSLNNAAMIVAIPVSFVLIGSLLLAQIYRYQKVSTAVEREQTKWVVFATIVGILSFLVAILMLVPTMRTGMRISQNWIAITIAFQMISIVVPIAIGMAILRYRLFDIDLIIRRTLMWGALTAILAVLYFGGVTLLQSAFTSLSGERSAAAVVLSTLAIAALFNPLRRRVQDFVDRRFYRRRYDAEKTLEGFAASVRNEVELDHISANLLTTVRDTMQPQQVSLWIKRQS